MADDEIDGCTDNDAELEIQSQATSTFDDATHLEVGRRTSLDRSYTMPAPSWEEGDQILKVTLLYSARTYEVTSTHADCYSSLIFRSTVFAKLQERQLG